MTTHLLPTSTTLVLLPPSTRLSKNNNIAAQFCFPKTPRLRFSKWQCAAAVSLVSQPPIPQSEVGGVSNNGKPFPAEVSRTILELSSVGTLSTPTQDGWPLGIAVRFAVDPHGSPLIFLNHSTSKFAPDSKSTLLVQVSTFSLGMRVKKDSNFDFFLMN